MYDSGATAWLLISASLVLLMTPALALFYGGMTRAKSVLNMMMMCFAALAIIPVVHVLWGWNISYGGTDIGGIFATPVASTSISDLVASGRIVDVAFQMTFAIIAVAIIAGSLAERVKIEAWAIFVVAWISLVYYPLAHMVWGGGILGHGVNGVAAKLFGVADGEAIIAPIDFAGGTVVHISAGTAGLVLAIFVGKRRGWPKNLARPHNLPMVMLGAALLWFGWCGFNGGSALAADSLAALAWVNTAVCAGAAALGWLAVEKIRDGFATSLGMASGIVAGLVAITPAAGVLNPSSSVILGVTAGALCASCIKMKYRFGFDDSLDVVAVHLLAGVYGTVALGVLAENRSVQLFIVQLLIAIIAMLFTAILTVAIAWPIKKFYGWRVDPEAEHLGIDRVQRESAYDEAGARG